MRESLFVSVLFTLVWREENDEKPSAWVISCVVTHISYCRRDDDDGGGGGGGSACVLVTTAY